MADPKPRSTTRSALVIDAVLVVIFFAFIYPVLAPHVQSHDPKWVIIWGGLASACLTGVFWLALQMIRVVYRAQREASRR